jgi:hypothetical protein
VGRVGRSTHATRHAPASFWNVALVQTHVASALRIVSDKNTAKALRHRDWGGEAGQSVRRQRRLRERKHRGSTPTH